MIPIENYLILSAILFVIGFENLQKKGKMKNPIFEKKT